MIRKRLLKKVKEKFENDEEQKQKSETLNNLVKKALRGE